MPSHIPSTRHAAVPPEVLRVALRHLEVEEGYLRDVTDVMQRIGAGRLHEDDSAELLNALEELRERDAKVQLCRQKLCVVIAQHLGCSAEDVTLSRLIAAAGQHAELQDRRDALRECASRAAGVLRGTIVGLGIRHQLVQSILDSLSGASPQEATYSKEGSRRRPSRPIVVDVRS